VEAKMKNVTISMKDEVLSELRVEAAKAGKSVSRHVADLIEASIRKPAPPAALSRNAQLEALERILSGPKWSVMRDGRMPTADERNER
jgi:plasmid stability protein